MFVFGLVVVVGVGVWVFVFLVWVCFGLFFWFGVFFGVCFVGLWGFVVGFLIFCVYFVVF